MGAASLRHSTIANAKSAATSKVVKALLRIVKRRYIKYHAFAFFATPHAIVFFRFNIKY